MTSIRIAAISIRVAIAIAIALVATALAGAYVQHSTVAPASHTHVIAGPVLCCDAI